MNVITFGDECMGYCETVAGGAGAVSRFWTKTTASRTLKSEFVRTEVQKDLCQKINAKYVQLFGFQFSAYCLHQSDHVSSNLPLASVVFRVCIISSCVFISTVRILEISLLKPPNLFRRTKKK